METLRGFEFEFRLRLVRLGDGAFLVSPAGELDPATVPELSAALAGLDGRPANRVIIDLSDVTFLDSTALGALVREARKRKLNGGELQVVCDDPRTLRALEVTGLDSVFAVHRTLRDALDAP